MLNLKKIASRFLFTLTATVDIGSAMFFFFFFLRKITVVFSIGTDMGRGKGPRGEPQLSPSDTTVTSCVTISRRMYERVSIWGCDFPLPLPPPRTLARIFRWWFHRRPPPPLPRRPPRYSDGQRRLRAASINNIVVDDADVESVVACARRRVIRDSRATEIRGSSHCVFAVGRTARRGRRGRRRRPSEGMRLGGTSLVTSEERASSGSREGEVPSVESSRSHPRYG